MAIKVNGSIIVSSETKDKALETINSRLAELGLDYEVSEQERTFTELKVTIKLSTLKAIKHIFKLVSAPEEEIKYLSKVKSVVEATVKDILLQVFKRVEQGK